MIQLQPQTLSQRLHIDIPLLSGILVLCSLGLFTLYSASGSNIHIVIKQAIIMVIAMLLMFSVAQLSPITIKRWSLWFFLLTIFMLIAVLWIGHLGKGAQRWLDMGLFRFQPSELVKLSVPMLMAWFFADKTLPPSTGNVLIISTIVGIPVILIAKQPDLGTALLLAITGCSVLFVAGIRYQLILLFTVIFLMCIPVIWHFFMHDYQRLRILTLFNYEQDPLGAGYHIIQSMIAIGSGGIDGKGWLHGTQSRLEFLPERSTDFIFSVYCEEFGFIGALFLICVYFFIITRCLYITVNAQQTYEKLLATALTLTFFSYIFVNMGMAVGKLPVVGVPLPLISRGGTSIVTLMIAFGILMSIQTHRRIVGN